MKKIHNQLCDRYGSTSNAVKKTKEALEDVDADSDGKVSIREFQECLKLLKV